MRAMEAKKGVNRPRRRFRYFRRTELESITRMFDRADEDSIG